MVYADSDALTEQLGQSKGDTGLMVGIFSFGCCWELCRMGSPRVAAEPVCSHETNIDREHFGVYNVSDPICCDLCVRKQQLVLAVPVAPPASVTNWIRRKVCELMTATDRRRLLRVPDQRAAVLTSSLCIVTLSLFESFTC